MLLRPSQREVSPPVPRADDNGRAALEERWRLPGMWPSSRLELARGATGGETEIYARNIENFIGTASVPVGIAGPLRVNGAHATGDYYVPLATTEATLVASYSRGAGIITASGGCTSLVLDEAIGRAPGFAFATLVEAAGFASWARRSLDVFRACAASTTRHGRLVDIEVTVEGNHVYLLLEFTTGDAAGQNMVTFATEAICRHIQSEAPFRPRAWFVEANLSGDKKATTRSLVHRRGRKVSAEIEVPAAIVCSRLHTDTPAILDCWRMSAIGAVISGSIGVQAHYANGLAALFIACGQDAASVVEAAVGITRMEAGANGALYVAVTLPNLVVGTVGGGTSLPSQRACLDILGLSGPGCANAFAEVAAALVLAGELSIVGALAAGEFGAAHDRLARGRSRPHTFSDR